MAAARFGRLFASPQTMGENGYGTEHAGTAVSAEKGGAAAENSRRIYNGR